MITMYLDCNVRMYNTTMLSYSDSWQYFMLSVCIWGYFHPAYVHCNSVSIPNGAWCYCLVSELRLNSSTLSTASWQIHVILICIWSKNQSYTVTSRSCEYRESWCFLHFNLYSQFLYLFLLEIIFWWWHLWCRWIRALCQKLVLSSNCSKLFKDIYYFCVFLIDW